MDKGGGLSIASDSVGFFLTKAGVLDPFHSAKRKREPSPLAAADDKRVVVGEMDFFSEKGRSGGMAGRDEVGFKVKKEEAGDPVDRDVNVIDRYVSLRPGFFYVSLMVGIELRCVSVFFPVLLIQTGLRLLTTNAGSDQSSVDDGASTEEKKARNEVSATTQKVYERL